LTLLPELGVVGLVIIVSMIKVLYRKKQEINGFCTQIAVKEDADRVADLNKALLVSMFGFLVTGIFLSVLYYPPLWNLSALIMTLYLISSGIMRQQARTAI
jgi:uncharacterized protein (DUF983 family)